MIGERHAIELRRIVREKAANDVIGDAAERVMARRVPNAEQVRSARSKHAISLRDRICLSPERTSRRTDTRPASKLASGNGRAVASACWNATSSPGPNFVRATSSIGGLRSVATNCARAGKRSRSSRVTIPVPAAVSRTRLGPQRLRPARNVGGIIREDERSKTAVVVLRDTADEACRVAVHDESASRLIAYDLPRAHARRAALFSPVFDLPHSGTAAPASRNLFSSLRDNNSCRRAADVRQGPPVSVRRAWMFRGLVGRRGSSRHGALGWRLPSR